MFKVDCRWRSILHNFKTQRVYELLLTQPSPVDSMREAVLTVSPKRQYLGIACPTTPAVYKNQNMQMSVLNVFILSFHVNLSIIMKYTNRVII